VWNACASFLDALAAGGGSLSSNCRPPMRARTRRCSSGASLQSLKVNRRKDISVAGHDIKLTSCARRANHSARFFLPPADGALHFPLQRFCAIGAAPGGSLMLKLHAVARGTHYPWHQRDMPQPNGAGWPEIKVGRPAWLAVTSWRNLPGVALMPDKATPAIATSVFCP